MIGSVLLAGVCLLPPMFDMDGPSCLIETEECRCSECLAWEATAGATEYRIMRTTLSTGNEVQVGIVGERVTDEDGTIDLPELWCVAKDVPFPHEGTSYRYTVVACNINGCSPTPSNGVTYVGSPYACFSNDREVSCYIGDPVVTR
jgi:hypothetical protein